MLEQVEKKIEELKKVQAKEYYKKKDEDLQSWGLASKKEGKKNIPIIVTNDEYEALIKASSGVGGTSRNKTARFLSTMSAVVLVLGIISGVGALVISDEMGFVYLSLAVVMGCIFAVIFKGLSEAINLLQQIIDTKPVESPQMSEEEVKSAGKKEEKKQAEPEYPVQNPVQQYPGSLFVTQENFEVAQPPIYHAQPQQAQSVQSYQSQSYAQQMPTVAPLNREEIDAANAVFQERSSEPQEF